jgi:aminoacylase
MAPTTSEAAVSNGHVSNGDAAANPKAVVDIPKLTTEESEAAIERFCEFLRFETVSRTGPQTGAYKACADWLLERLKEIPVFSSSAWLLEEAPENSPVVVACWKGVDESLPVLLLNSHYDVVPALAEDWSKPPFAGLRQDGIIWGRGCQDMKSVCMQYVEAIRKIITDAPDWKPARSIYLTFVPDEGACLCVC